MTMSEKNKRIIYMDNAATTRMYPEVYNTMVPYLTEEYGNPSGTYGLASVSKKAIGTVREELANLIGCRPNEILFTSGGTEADNWAVRAVLETYMPGLLLGDSRQKYTPHIITSAIEHHAILNSCRYLESLGVEVTYVRPDENGVINPSVVEASIRNNTCLVSVMMANNETGVIQPIKEIGAIAHKHKLFMHTDAVQAFSHVLVNVEELNVDMMSVSAHKFNGPKGVGFLYASEDIHISPFIYGGGQEGGRRAGTENVAAIVGMGEAAKLNHHNMEKNISRVTVLRDTLIDKLQNDTELAGLVRVNGINSNRLPGIVNVMIKGIDGESVLLYLGMKGVCISAGAACTSSDGHVSHVLRSMGLSEAEAGASLRISLGNDNSMEEIDDFVTILKEVIKR